MVCGCRPFFHYQDMMKPSIILFSLLIAAGTALAQAPTGKPGRVVPTVTRTIQMFSTLENEWLDAVQRRDQDALKKIVAPNFEQRSAAAPGTPTPRAESIGHALQQPPFHSSIEQMAAHEFGELVVVSFLWKLEVPKTGALPQKVFVVDTWKRSDGEWQVVTRYTAPVADAARNVPGEVLSAPVVNKKI
jgi:ketosteroid isomerase-like protein